jgi:hypothetical protein
VIQDPTRNAGYFAKCSCAAKRVNGARVASMSFTKKLTFEPLSPIAPIMLGPGLPMRPLDPLSPLLPVGPSSPLSPYNKYTNYSADAQIVIRNTMHLFDNGTK